jgi:hypothetical protein
MAILFVRLLQNTAQSGLCRPGENIDPPGLGVRIARRAACHFENLVNDVSRNWIGSKSPDGPA